MARRSLAIANLRALTILLVVSFHSVLAYLSSQPASQPHFDAPPYAWLAIPIHDPAKWLGFDLYCAFLYVFLMPLMFFISGLFVWPSLSRKGARAFVRDRCLRIGVPFILGAALLMPAAHCPVYRLTASDPSWFAFWEHWTALPFWPTGPLWFLWHILLLGFISAALYQFAPGFGGSLRWLGARAGERPGRYLCYFTILSLLAYLPLASIFKPWEWTQFGPFSMQSAQVLLFVAYFFAGAVTGANGIEHGLLEPDGTLACRWRLLCGLAIAAFLAWLTVTALSVESKAPPFWAGPLSSFLFAISSAAACFAFVAVALRFASHRSDAASSLSANAYGIYLVHYFFVIWLQYLLFGVAIFAAAKGAIVFISALALSWAAVIAPRCIPLLGQPVFEEGRAPAAAPGLQFLPAARLATLMKWRLRRP
jgi:fucose 4-O-acetylase-like acetyltransferase